MLRTETSLSRYDNELGDQSGDFTASFQQSSSARTRPRTSIKRSTSTPSFASTEESVTDKGGSPPPLSNGALNLVEVSQSRPTSSATSTENNGAPMGGDVTLTAGTQRISRAKKGKRVHACHHPGCEKIFTRAEHLRRHQLNHSTAVHYKCHLCDKTFVRQDLLTRHAERHALQAKKAVQTLALAQRHRQFSSQYDIDGVNVVTTTQHATDYSGSEPVFQEHQLHPQPPPLVTSNMPIAPQILSAHHSHPTSPAIATMAAQHSNSPTAAFSPSYPATMAIAHSGNSPLGYISGTSTTPSPSIGIRPHLPFHLQQNEPSRPAGYMQPVTSHPDVGQESEEANQYLQRSVPPWDKYRWMFDESPPEHVLREKNRAASTTVASTLHPLEAQHHHSVALGYDPTNDLKSPVPLYNPITDHMREWLFKIFANCPDVHPGNSSPHHLDQYLLNFWTIFHPMMPILHRATFFPHSQLHYLVAIVLAMGASYGDSEAKQFAYAVHHLVRNWILRSDEYTTYNPDSLSIRQLILLTDIFGKMRVPEGDIHNTELELLLLMSIRRSPIVSFDILDTVRGYLREGIQFSYRTEWATWVDLESKKRVALFFFFWDAQQFLLFGREMFHTVFDIDVHLPCNGYVWALDTPAEWIAGLDGQPESISFLEMMQSYINPRRVPQAPSPAGNVFTIYGFMAIGREMQLRRSPETVIPTAEEVYDKQTKLLRGLERWRAQFDEIYGQVLVEPWYHKILSIYHMAYITLHVDFKTLLLSAGDFRAFTGTPEDIYRAEQQMQTWSTNTVASQIATWHAVQILLRYLSRSQLYQRELYVTWCVYIAALVCWNYGKHAQVHDMSPHQEDPMMWDPQHELGLYMQHMNTVSWETLTENRGYCKRTAGLLTIVMSTLENSQWDHIQKSVEVLRRINYQRSARPSV